MQTVPGLWLNKDYGFFDREMGANRVHFNLDHRKSELYSVGHAGFRIVRKPSDVDGFKIPENSGVLKEIIIEDWTLRGKGLGSELLAL